MLYALVAVTIMVAASVSGYILYPMLSTEPAGPPRMAIDMARGRIVMELYPDKMPTTANHILELVKMKNAEGRSFFDGLAWHRVEDWVVQCCEDLSGTAKPIPLETHPELLNRRGMVAMARTTDPNSATSQFYILKKDATWLDGEYAVFGKVISGMEVVDGIQKGDTLERVYLV